MIEQDIYKIVPQIPGENDSSYCRLIIMLKKGFRNLHELHDYLEQENHKYYVKYSTLKYNSTKDNWQQRREKYYNIRDQELKEEVEELFQKLNVIGIHDMELYFKDIETLHKDVMKEYKNKTKEFTANKVSRILNQCLKCYRQATEIYYINSRHPLTPNNENTNTQQDTEKLNQFTNIITGASKK